MGEFFGARPPEAEITPTRAETPETERDAERIARDFRELPSDRVELLAVNLARPDGFVKELITGRLATSAEIAEGVGPGFVRTHRGHYKGWTTGFSRRQETNDYLSFKIGRAESSYGATSTRQEMAGRGGLGVAMSARKLLAAPETEIVFGNLHLPTSVKLVKDTVLMEPEFEQVVALEEDVLWKQENQPAKDDFLTRVHISRKAGELHAGDQAEVNLRPGEDGQLPSLAMGEMVILIPAASREAVERLIRLKLKEMQPQREAILEKFGVDVAEVTPEEVLGRYSSIYWYPQENVDLAVQYLSAHPEKMRELLDPDADSLEKAA